MTSQVHSSICSLQPLPVFVKVPSFPYIYYTFPSSLYCSQTFFSSPLFQVMYIASEQQPEVTNVSKSTWPSSKNILQSLSLPDVINFRYRCETALLCNHTGNCFTEQQPSPAGLPCYYILANKIWPSKPSILFHFILKTLLT